LAVLTTEGNVYDREVSAHKVVIDGPSLVYYIYDGLLRKCNPTDIFATALPTYKHVVTAVHSFVSKIEAQGVQM
jgi:hypothetical protein